MVAETAKTHCDRCAIATDCLLEALRLDAARRRGEDPWGAYGMWGGIWFSPDQMPARPAHRSRVARAAHPGQVPW